jgi:Tfp pilus assembly protein PilX
MRSLIRRARKGAAQDDGSGLILVFLVMLISSALSLVLLEGAVSMAKQTSANNKRVTSLSAAQAGLDAGLGQIRDAYNVLTNTGDVSTIPCTITGAQVGGTNTPSQGTTTGSYTVAVSYFSSDPTAQSDLWRTNSSNQINCPNGGHPDKVPSFALIKSTGVSAAGKPRTVQSTYIFTTTNQNISGGLIHAYNDGSAAFVDLCPDAGSAHPAVGDNVTMQPCDQNDPGQQWAYQSDLSFLLTSTTNDTGTKAPMCIQGAGSPSAAKGTLLKMAACSGQPLTCAGVPCPVTIQQQFSFDDSAHFRNTYNSSPGHPTLAGYCWTQTSVNTAGTTLQLTDGCGGYATNNTWRPVPAVGAGMSGVATQQLVNYQEFGRCMDATDQDPAHSYMIAFPCKQSPSPSEITWNQKYSYDSSKGTISTAVTGGGYAGQTFCLNSPMATQSNPAVAGPFVTLQVCPTTIPTSMKWTEVGNTGNYLTSYVVHDSSNPQLCLGLGLTGGSLGSSEAQWDSLYVQTCDGSLEQKWNAPPNVPVGTLTGYNETTTNGG